MNTPLSTAAIILAAGSSSRMGGGRHKLLLPLEDRPVLAHVIDASLESQAHPVIIVLGHQSGKVRSYIKQYTKHDRLILIENVHYQQGMSSSLRKGIQTILAIDYKNKDNSLRIGSALIVLGDQPLITSKIIDALITAYRSTGKAIVAPLYLGKRGSPVLFDRSLFPELNKVTGDEGGRTVLERHRHEVELIEIGDALANYDVDTWEAYEQVVEAKKGQS